MPPSIPALIPVPRPNVKSRLQMVKGSPQEQQTPSSGPEQQWKQPQQNQQQQQQQQQEPLLLQQRRNSSLQSANKPGAQVPQKNTPLSVRQGPAQTLGPKPGAKRTVMQRVKNSGVEAQQVPQKVRVVKLSGPVSSGFHFYLTPSFVSDIYLILCCRFYPQGKLHNWGRKCH